MQAIIMAAGKGSRLEELTKQKPKCFLEIQGIRLIEYNVALLHERGIKDIIIVTGYMHEMIERFYADMEGIRFIYNPFYELMNVLGSFFMAQNALKEDQDTVYMHADTLCDPQIFEEMLTADGDMVLPVDFHICDEEAMKVKTSEGKLTRISKQIPCEEGEGEFIGIAKISKCLLPALKAATVKLMEQKVFQAYFEGAVAELIKENSYLLNTIDTRGRFWGEIDFLEDYQRVEQTIPHRLAELVGEDRKRQLH